MSLVIDPYDYVVELERWSLLAPDDLEPPSEAASWRADPGADQLAFLLAGPGIVAFEVLTCTAFLGAGDAARTSYYALAMGVAFALYAIAMTTALRGSRGRSEWSV